MSKKDKLTIWFIGSNATGKTTQAALLHLYLRDNFNKKFNGVVHICHEPIETFFTQVSPVSSNLGKFSHPLVPIIEEKTNECCGTDTLAKKEQIILAHKLAMEHSPIVIVEGIMATGKWIEFLNDYSKLLLIHLDCSEEVNFERLRERKARKSGINTNEIELNDKTKKNLTGKVRGFRSLFKRMEGFADRAISINTDNKSVKRIHKIIIKHLIDVL